MTYWARVSTVLIREFAWRAACHTPNDRARRVALDTMVLIMDTGMQRNVLRN